MEIMQDVLASRQGAVMVPISGSVGALPRPFSDRIFIASDSTVLDEKKRKEQFGSNK
jgi:hypothetical protein